MTATRGCLLVIDQPYLIFPQTPTSKIYQHSRVHDKLRINLTNVPFCEAKDFEISPEGSFLQRM